LARALSLTCADEAFFKGIEMTMTQLLNIFEELGVKPIDALGQKFDANLHNAVMHVEDDEHGESEIVEEFQKGFTLGDKVIRHSMVKVAN
jgi:molecular chaperone GrpE